MTTGGLDTPAPSTLITLTAVTAGITTAVWGVVVSVYRDQPRHGLSAWGQLLADVDEVAGRLLAAAALRPGPAFSALLAFGALVGAGVALGRAADVQHWLSRFGVLGLPRSRGAHRPAPAAPAA